MAATRGTRRGNGVGVGQGWGGSPKGAGTGKRPAYKAGERMEGQGAGRGNFSLAGEERRARDERHAELMKERMFTLALGAEREETQLSASVAYLNRLEGTPLTRTLNASIDDLSSLSDDDLRAEIERLDRAAREAGAGNVAPAVPVERDGVVD